MCATRGKGFGKSQVAHDYAHLARKKKPVHHHLEPAFLTNAQGHLLAGSIGEALFLAPEEPGTSTLTPLDDTNIAYKRKSIISSRLAPDLGPGRPNCSSMSDTQAWITLRRIHEAATSDPSRVG